MATFTRQEIESGLRKLGELAQAKGLKIQLTLVGGAVMVLRFGARLSTRDVAPSFFFRLKQKLFVNWRGRSPKKTSGLKIG